MAALVQKPVALEPSLNIISYFLDQCATLESLLTLERLEKLASLERLEKLASRERLDKVASLGRLAPRHWPRQADRPSEASALGHC